jgi:hypothetical protein
MNMNNNGLKEMAEMLRNDDLNAEELSEIEEETEEIEVLENTKLNAPIFRFKFTEEFMGDLYKFSKIHQYDDRKDFKEAWLNWVEENDDIIQEEMDRLNNLGYDGDILDKMFKSARYYFRKKSPIKAEPKTRRQYISVNHELLDAMDAHIRSTIRSDGFQPKNGFVSFCHANDQLVKGIIVSIYKSGNPDLKMIQQKLKKTYKNRYFMLISK